MITGSAIGDNRAVELELGVVRAFAARSGRRVWLWDPVPRDLGDPAHDHWKPEQAALTGAANAWSVLSVDPARDLGGPIVTASGLIFIAAATDNYLRAFDVDTGEELWKGALPAGGQATPMTYHLEEAGKQYVAIAAGGHGGLGTARGDYVLAFALPDAVAR